MEFRLLGPLEVEGAPSLGGPKQRLLLALLLLARGEPVPEARLVDALWPEEPPETARHALQVYVSALRKAIAATGAELARRGAGYALVPGPARVDADAFADLAQAGAAALAAGDAARARERLREALGLWRGPLLADLDGVPAGAAAELEELRLHALEDLGEAELELGLHDEATARLEAAAREHPGRERLHRQLMIALYRGGRQGDALEAYRRARTQLAEELGLDPSRELRELEAAILRQDPSLDPPRADVRLPAPLTPLVGREREAAEVVALLAGGTRLVTLTGPGGIGKTRLAIEAASRAAGGFRDGVRFVELAPFDRPELVGGAIAAGAGADPAQPLAEQLRPLALLLVVDNLEHVLDAAPLLSELLRAAPRLAVLATSRVPLDLYGEHEYPVPPLAADDAVALFRARARGGRAGGDVAREICERLDRLPLAIELAAARTRDHDAEELLPLLERRLELASGGPRDVDPRQQGLRTAIEWSRQLLDEEAERAFGTLAVFAGGWTPEAATAVGAAPAAVEELERQSLVARQAARRRMLETIREYAAELLDARADAEDVRRRHAEHVLAAVRAAEETRDYEALGAELPNLRAALAWALGRDDRLALELAVAPRLFWRVRGHYAEAERWLGEALATGAGDDPLRAEATLVRATLAFRQGRYDDAERLWQESLELWRRTGDEAGLGRALGELGVAAAMRGEYERAREHFEESVRLLRAAGHPRLHVGLANLGTVAADLGDDEESTARFAEALEAARAVGDEEGVASALQNLGSAQLRLGRRDEARATLLEGLAASQRIGYVDNAAFCLATLATAAEGERAARLGGAAAGLLAGVGAAPQPGMAATLDRARATAREQLGEAAADAAWADGEELSLDEAVELAGADAR